MTLTAFKILKYKTPFSVYELFKTSKRKETLLINQLTQSSSGFTSNTNKIWNLARQKLKLVDLTTINTSTLKTTLKKTILDLQGTGDKLLWVDSEIDVVDMLKANSGYEFVSN